MNIPKDQQDRTPQYQPESWRRPLTVSFIIHACLIGAMLIGIPFLPKRVFDEPMSISVEVVEVSDMARTTRPEASTPEVQKKAETEKPPQPKQNLEPPKPPEIKKPEPKPEPPKPEPKKEEPPAPPPPDELAEAKEQPKPEPEP